jgi:hypothetical protein
METTSVRPRKRPEFIALALRQVGAAASPLDLGSAPLLLEPPFAGGSSWLRRAATTARSKRVRHSPPEARDRELTVACLTATVLRNRGHPRAEPRSQRVLLLGGQRLRGVDLEDSLDPRGGDVRVLPSRSRRAAGSQLDLGLGNLGGTQAQ